MGVRTGKGNNGTTGLLFNQRIKKDTNEIRALGDLDELNSYLGLVKIKTKAKKDKELLEKIQIGLSKIATEIVIGPKAKKKHGPILKRADIQWIEKAEYELEKRVKIENHFYLPGEGELSVFLDITRTVARRAERAAVRLFRKETVLSENILEYLNCISDILFIMARNAAKKKKTSRK